MLLKDKKTANKTYPKYIHLELILIGFLSTYITIVSKLLLNLM